MAERKAGNADSRAVVDWLKADPAGKSIIASEIDYIVDQGLMTMAGRVAAKPAGPAGQGELFPLGTPKAFTDLRRRDGGGAASERVKTSTITLDEWKAQPPTATVSKVKPHTNRDVVAAYFKKMEDEGVSGTTTLGEYLGLQP